LVFHAPTLKIMNSDLTERSRTVSEPQPYSPPVLEDLGQLQAQTLGAAGSSATDGSSGGT